MSNEIRSSDNDDGTFDFSEVKAKADSGEYAELYCRVIGADAWESIVKPTFWYAGNEYKVVF